MFALFIFYSQLLFLFYISASCFMSHSLCEELWHMESIESSLQLIKVCIMQKYLKSHLYYLGVLV